MTDPQALSLAEGVLDGQVRLTGGHATRASAVLARQALEEIIDGLIDSAHLGLGRASMRSD